MTHSQKQIKQNFQNSKLSKFSGAKLSFIQGRLYTRTPVNITQGKSISESIDTNVSIQCPQFVISISHILTAFRLLQKLSFTHCGCVTEAHYPSIFASDP